MNELYDGAMAANENGMIHEWIVEYLRGSGRNTVLADGLQQDGQFHTGLIDYPFDTIKNLMGPDKSFRHYEEPTKFEERIAAMIESLEQGWKPAPLIATDIWNDGLELNDGAHRAEALKRFGIETYPTIFYFKEQAMLSDFILAQPHSSYDG